MSDGIIKNLIWAAAFTASIGIVANFGFGYLSTKNNNKHYSEKAQADIERATKMAELESLRMKRIESLLSNPEYRTYLQERKELTEKILKDSRLSYVDVIEIIVDQALGDFNFDYEE